MINRGDNEIKEKTLIIRDLPLNVERSALLMIAQKYGEVEDMRLSQAHGIKNT